MRKLSLSKIHRLSKAAVFMTFIHFNAGYPTGLSLHSLNLRHLLQIFPPFIIFGYNQHVSSWDI